MTRFATVSLLAFAASRALATPWNWPNSGSSGWGTTNHGPGGHGRDRGNCLSYAQANSLAEAYGTLIANYTDELANAVLSVDFTDYSESVNTLIDSCPQGSAAITLPLLAPTFSNRTQFEIGQGQQAHINFQQLNLWPACKTVILRWQTTNTAPIANPKPVNGIIVLETEAAPAGNTYNGTAYPYVISTVYSEFDAGAWLQNLEAAGICATASATSAAPTTAPTSGPAGHRR